MRKDRLDRTGLLTLLAVTLLLAFNQIVIKIVDHDLQPVFFAGARSALAVVFVGLWLWLLSVYPTATVASFSFLTPIFALTLGFIFFGESLTPGLTGAAMLVSAGIVLINRRV